MKEHNLTYRQAAFVLNVSEERILHEFIKHFNLTPIPTKFVGARTEKEIQVRRRKAIRDLKGLLWDEQKKMSSKALSDIFNVDVDYLIENINTKFWKDPVCVGYLEKHFTRKLLPNKKTGLLPISVTAPAEIMALLTYDNRMLMEAWFYKKYGDLTDFRGHLLNIKFKHS